MIFLIKENVLLDKMILQMLFDNENSGYYVLRNIWQETREEISERINPVLVSGVIPDSVYVSCTGIQHRPVEGRPPFD